MTCPRCRSKNTYVKDTRGSDTELVQRRRVCADCGLSFWAYELAYEQYKPDILKPRKQSAE
jgi:transcriptional regulator NrdR family protein